MPVRSFMAVMVERIFLSSVLILALAVGIGPQSSTSAADGQPKQSSTPATSSPQSSSDSQAQQQKTVSVYESATVLKTITRLVVVDVVATDKNGPVTDLERNDFSILEDGKEQQIRVFSFQQPHLAAANPAQPAQKLPENVYSNHPKYNVDNSLNVVLMDALNTTLPHQAYVRDQMIRYLEKMPAGRPVAVYALSTKLTLLQDFTSDPEVLKGVVKRLKGKVSPLL